MRAGLRSTSKCFHSPIAAVFVNVADLTCSSLVAFLGLDCEYIETFKMRGMIEDFGRLTRETFTYAYRSAALARCYRNMAYYFVEIKDYKAAVCCLLFSGQFEKSEIVSAELYYISQQTGEMYQPTRDELDEYFKKNDIPFGPPEDALKIAYAYGMHFHEEDDDASTVYFLSIVAEFVDDKEINEILDEIKAKG